MGSAFTLLEYVEMDVFLLKKKIRTCSILIQKNFNNFSHPGDIAAHLRDKTLLRSNSLRGAFT